MNRRRYLSIPQMSFLIVFRHKHFKDLIQFSKKGIAEALVTH